VTNGARQSAIGERKIQKDNIQAKTYLYEYNFIFIGTGKKGQILWNWL